MKNIALKIIVTLLTLVIIIAAFPFAYTIYNIWIVHRTEVAIKNEWSNFSNWKVLDELIDKEGKENGSFGIYNVDVPGKDKIHQFYIYKDRVAVEFGGGHHHFGVMYFKNIAALNSELSDRHNSQIAELAVFYSE